MRFGVVGCGFVADLYLRTLALHPELELGAVLDHDRGRSDRLAHRHGVRSYRSLAALLEDETIDLVVNLTPPTAHAEVSRACLDAGRAVYSEKPLALGTTEAHELVELAEERGVGLACAPCTVLGESAQTLWRALREQRIGPARLAYAEMDDGLLHRAPYRHWVGPSGTRWPWKSELETGCTLEHAAYQVTWLATFFGPVRSLTAFASIQVPEKETDLPLDVQAPDFSLAALHFESGMVARLSCSIVAPREHGLRIVGDEGVLSVGDVWRSRCPVRLRRWINLRRRQILSPWGRRLPLAGLAQRGPRRSGASAIDYLRGVSELAAAMEEKRPCRLSARFSLHVNEVVLAVHAALAEPGTRQISSRFDPPAPMPWAR